MLDKLENEDLVFLLLIREKLGFFWGGGGGGGGGHFLSVSPIYNNKTLK